MTSKLVIRRKLVWNQTLKKSFSSYWYKRSPLYWTINLKKLLVSFFYTFFTPSNTISRKGTVMALFGMKMNFNINFYSFLLVLIFFFGCKWFFSWYQWSPAYPSPPLHVLLHVLSPNTFFIGLILFTSLVINF